MLEFVFSTDDTALVEITDSNMRVWVSDALVTRPTVTSVVNNSGFDSSVDTFGTERSNPKNFALYGITYGNSLFVAVGAADGTDSYIVTSSDGATWTEQSNPSNFILYSVAWSGTLFVAVGATTLAADYIITSSDGITWSAQNSPKNFILYSVTYGNSIFVAVGAADGTDAYIVTSSDGITWTESANPKNFQLEGVTWSGTLFVAVGAADGTDAYVITSADGVTWTEKTNPKNFALYSVTYGNSLYVAVGAADGTDAYVITSSDGTTWTERTNTKNFSLNDISYTGAMYLAVGAADGTDAYIITSSDGTTWTEVANAKNFTLYGVTTNDGTIVAVGAADGTDAYIISGNGHWIDEDESGGTSAWVTGGYLGLTGNGTNAAIRRQAILVPTASLNVEHAIRIDVERGPVTLRVGSTYGGDEYINETTLGTGLHSLTLTPTGNFYIQLQSRTKRQVLVDSCAIESSGTMVITAPWLEADLDNLRFDQSGDVLYIACEDYQQRKIERRSSTSWSLVKYEPEDGPFGLINTGTTTITPSALTGNITLTASKALFRSTHVGSLWRIASTGQTVTASATAENQFTNPILVEGTSTNRVFTIVITGTWVATVTLQRSLVSEDGPWQDVTTYTANTTVAYNDALDNQIAWYRIGVKTGGYTSGTVSLQLTYTIGTIEGIARITAYTSATSVSAEVIEDFGGTSASEDWYEGEWSDVNGWPTSVAFAEGRLFWAGKNGIWGSVSDAFESFDDLTTGDSGPISRTIGSGPVDTINWILALQRLLLGAEGSEFVCKSTSFDEPLTPTNFNVKPASTQGSAAVEAMTIDKLGVYVQRGGTRVMEIAYDSNDTEYGSKDLTVLCPEVTSAQVKRMAVQRQPDTRIHCVLADGTVALAIFDRAENVLCWSTIETDGDIEDVAILPGVEGQTEDQVYYVVKRTINSATVRFLEKWALESECVGGSLNKQADAYILISQASSTTISGLSHLEGESVVVWANSKSLGSYTVASSAITVSEAVTTAVVGLTYTAQWKSTKFAMNGALDVPLSNKGIITHLGLLLKNTHYQGVQYGRDFTTMYDLPGVEDGTAVTADTVHTTYEEEVFEFPGEWTTDNRLCLQSVAPKPATIVGAIIKGEGHGKG